MNIYIKFLIFAFYVLYPIVNLKADSIPTLFNTGVDNSGVVLSQGSQDPHYTFTRSDMAGTFTPVSFKDPGWVANTSTYAWIAPSASQNQAEGVYYTYTTHFDLTGYILNSVNIAFQIWQDDILATPSSLNAILVNGNPLTPPYVTGGYLISNPGVNLIPNSDLIHGVNTISFTVYNIPNPQPLNPTGIRTAFMVNSAVLAPEPSEYLILGSFLAMSLFLLYRKNRIFLTGQSPRRLED